MVDLSKIDRQPVFAFKSKALGHLTFRYLSVGTTIELQEADEAQTFDSETFFDALVSRLGRKPPPEHADEAGEEKDGFSTLSEAEIAQLPSDERAAIAEGLVGGLRLDREPVWETDDDEEGRRIARIASYKILLERTDGETAEEFLLRAWRDHAERFAENSKKMMRGVLGEATKISESLKRAITPGLLENITASQRLGAQISQMMPSLKIADQLKGVTSISDHIKDLGIGGIGGIGRDIGALGRSSPNIADIARGASAFPRYEEVEIPRLPELKFTNPIHETNERLTEMGGHIAEMRELAATTATMQQSLNTVATQILTQFAEGAEKSKKVGYLALSVGVISAVLALVAILTGLWGDFRQDGQDRASDRAAQARLDEELSLRRQELEASNRLAAAIEAQRPQARPAPPAKQ